MAAGAAKASPRILIILTEAIGDVLLSTPTLRAARKSNPEAPIAYLTGARAAPLLEGNPHLNQVIVVEEEDRSWIHFLKLARKIRREQFDIALQLSPYRKYHLLGRLAGIPCRLGLDHQGWPWAHTRLIKAEPLSNLHRSEYYLAFALELGWEPRGVELDLFLKPRELDWARQTLRERGLDRGVGVIGIHPGVSRKFRSQRRWPSGKFKQLIRMLTERGYRVLLFEVPDDREEMRRIWEGGDRRVLIWFSPSLRAVAALMGACDAVITLDSAPLHISLALGTPVVTLFSGIPSASPAHWGPRYGRFELIQGDPIGEIEVAEVLSRTERLLGRAHPERGWHV